MFYKNHENQKDRLFDFASDWQGSNIERKGNKINLQAVKYNWYKEIAHCSMLKITQPLDAYL